MRSPVIAALALGLCLGCVIQGVRMSPASASPSAPVPAPVPAVAIPEAAGAPALQTGTIAPVLIPMQTVLLQMQNAGETVSSSNDIIVHCRNVDNAYDAANGEKRLGFTGIVSPLGMGSQTSAGPDATNQVVMAWGVGLIRGLRPRLTTNTVAAGAESSTMIVYANQNVQWACLVESATVGARRAWFQLLPGPTGPGVSRDFTSNMTIVVATRTNPTQAWSVDGPRALTTAERAVCLTAWGKAQIAGIIPSTEPFPP